LAPKRILVLQEVRFVKDDGLRLEGLEFRRAVFDEVLVGDEIEVALPEVGARQLDAMVDAFLFGLPRVELGDLTHPAVKRCLRADDKGR
jgi:hypothetical protein